MSTAVTAAGNGSPSAAPKLTILNMLGIFGLFSFMAEFTIMTPSIAAFSAHFDGTPFTTIMLANTITGVIGIPMSILAGATVNKIGYRPMAIVGALIMIFGGAFPFLMPDLAEYWPVIFSRILVGVGYGLIFPLGGAFFILYFKGKKRSQLLGAGIMVQFGFAILFSLVAGMLTDIAWNYSFLTYLISLVPFVFVAAFLPEAKHLGAEADKAKAAAQAGTIKQKIPHATYAYIVVFGLVLWMMYIVVNFLASIILGERGIGDAGAAGLMASCFCLGNVASGLLFPHAVGFLKSRTFGVFGIIAAAGLVVAYLSDSVMMYGTGAFLIGLGGSTVYVAAQNSIGNISPKPRVPFTNGLLTAAMNLASFFVAYWITFGQEALPSFGTGAPMVIGAAIVAVTSVVCLFIPFKGIRMGIAPGTSEETA
ncbi:MAG: MFS transporter [Coriobacteriaceae bacterium]|jgi:MFS family permease|nr:MFS transporter [Coriobacteriaceae bacterium]